MRKAPAARAPPRIEPKGESGCPSPRHRVTLLTDTHIRKLGDAKLGNLSPMAWLPRDERGPRRAGLGRRADAMDSMDVAMEVDNSPGRCNKGIARA